MKNIILALIVLLMSGCYNPRTPTYVANAGPVYWTEVPVVVYVDDSLPSYSVEAVRQAAEEWNTLVGSDIFEVHPISAVSVHLMMAPRQSITVSQAELGTRLLDVGQGEPLEHFQVHTLLGTAELSYYSYSVIHSCMVLLDYEVTETSALPVMTHELGHCLGLRHSFDNRSIMYYTAVLSDKQHITTEDLNNALLSIPYR